MATSSPYSHLLDEMKYSFPEVPEDIIRSCIHKFSGDREKCRKELQEESEQIRYGPFPSDSIGSTMEIYPLNSVPKSEFHRKELPPWSPHENYENKNDPISRYPAVTTSPEMTYSTSALVTTSPRDSFPHCPRTRHITQLNVTPAPFNEASSSTSGHHTTSFNVQVNNPAGRSTFPPFSFSTSGNASCQNPQEYSPHLHISITQGETNITASRLLPRPPPQPHGVPNPSAQLSNVSASAVDPIMNENYIQVYLKHQQSQYDLLYKTYSKQLEVLHSLRTEIQAKERELLLRNSQSGIFNLDQLNKLREENRKLHVQCHCLSREVDLYSKGQVPLGVTDEDFYNRIFTGQMGPIPPAPQQSLALEQRSPLARSGETVLSEQEENQDENKWRCSKCTFLNHPALDKCEVCEMPKVVVGNLFTRRIS